MRAATATARTHTHAGGLEQEMNVPANAARQKGGACLPALHVRRGEGIYRGGARRGIRFAAPRSGSGRGAPPLAGDQCVRSDPCTRINGRARSDQAGAAGGRGRRSPASGGRTGAWRWQRDLLQPNHRHRLRRPSSSRACFAFACRAPCSRIPRHYTIRRTPLPMLVLHLLRSSRQDGRDREKITWFFKKIKCEKDVIVICSTHLEYFFFVSF